MIKVIYSKIASWSSEESSSSARRFTLNFRPPNECEKNKQHKISSTWLALTLMTASWSPVDFTETKNLADPAFPLKFLNCKI